MTTILGIDLGKFKSVFCLFCKETGEIQYHTLATNPEVFRAFLMKTAPTMTLFETSTAAGWIYDLCRELCLPCKVVNPLGEAWQWKRVKRKTDRDDAHKLIRMYDVGELPTVYMPPPENQTNVVPADNIRALDQPSKHISDRVFRVFLGAADAVGHMSGR